MCDTLLLLGHPVSSSGSGDGQSRTASGSFNATLQASNCTRLSPGHINQTLFPPASGEPPVWALDIFMATAVAHPVEILFSQGQYSNPFPGLGEEVDAEMQPASSSSSRKGGIDFALLKGTEGGEERESIEVNKRTNETFLLLTVWSCRF
jgi:hypothetical protein